jgi:hypothetical protein
MYTWLSHAQAQYSRLWPIKDSSGYNGSLVTSTVISLASSKLKPPMLLSGQLHAQVALSPEKVPPVSTGWGLEPVTATENRKILTLKGLELLSLFRPARSQQLYRLSYRGSSLNIGIIIIGLCILLRVYQSISIETSVRNKCWCTV